MFLGFSNTTDYCAFTEILVQSLPDVNTEKESRGKFLATGITK